ncbi:hypothetical protein P3X46_019993, partial [Hevea brasiliensis]
GRKLDKPEPAGPSLRPASKSADRPDIRIPARAYAIRAQEEQDAPHVIRGMFSLYNTSMHALVDPGSTHSYICIKLPIERGVPVEECDQDILVTNPLSHSVVVNKVYKGCQLRIQGYEFSADLIELPFHEFDVILGMDWLSRHQAIVDCKLKRISLKTSEGNEITVVGERTDFLSNVISATVARRLMRKGCEAYLAHVVDTRQAKPNLCDIPTVRDFPDVFPEELPGLPPEREVEFAIEVMPSTAPISIAPYRMAPTELRELKTQLQELLDKGFIRPSVSPWGAPVLFVKKKDGTLRLCIDYRQLNK